MDKQQDHVAEAIALMDKSAERTTPNAQTRAWAILRAEIERLREYEQAAAMFAVEKAEQRRRAEAAEARVRELEGLLRETAAVAITMLYNSHKADTLAEFSVEELGQVVEASAPLLAARAQVEHVYRRAWDAAIDAAREAPHGD